MADPTIRPVTDEEYPAFVTAFIEGFADDVPSDSFVDQMRSTLPPERTLAAFDDGAIVGTFGGYALDVTVPGGAAVPMEGTTVVTVFPTHRRMGLLRSMMADHLDRAVAAGYAIAGLWASESDIYGRFGYGTATSYRSYELKTSGVEFRSEVEIDRVRRIAPDQAHGIFSGVFDAVVSTRPGMFSRSRAWWDHEVLADEEWMRRGRSTKRYVVHDGPDGPDGYAIYRTKASESDDNHADGKVDVIELVAATPRAHASLWSYVTHVDMCPNIRSWNVPLDDPLPAKVRESRRVRTSAVSDGLWIRILDVPSALGARTYETDGSIVVEVSDPFLPATGGRYRLDVAGGRPTVAITDASPEIACDIDVLGSLYLGGGDAFALADAGRIVGGAEDVVRLQRMFRTDRAPWCNQVF
jgi:predicted acetyltransferase